MSASPLIPWGIIGGLYERKNDNEDHHQHHPLPHHHRDRHSRHRVHGGGPGLPQHAVHGDHLRVQRAYDVRWHHVCHDLPQPLHGVEEGV